MVYHLLLLCNITNITTIAAQIRTFGMNAIKLTQIRKTEKSTCLIQYRKNMPKGWEKFKKKKSKKSSQLVCCTCASLFG